MIFFLLYFRGVVMNNTKQCYEYDGPVYFFNNMLTPRWSCQTYAVSEARARSNLEYRFKCAAGLQKYAKITLPGKLTIIKTDDVITLF